MHKQTQHEETNCFVSLGKPQESEESAKPHAIKPHQALEPHQSMPHPPLEPKQLITNNISMPINDNQ